MDEMFAGVAEKIPENKLTSNTTDVKNFLTTTPDGEMFLQGPQGVTLQ